jgi:hypothetical protein
MGVAMSSIVQFRRIAAAVLASAALSIGPIGSASAAQPQGATTYQTTSCDTLPEFTICRETEGVYNYTVTPNGRVKIIDESRITVTVTSGRTGDVVEQYSYVGGAVGQYSSTGEPLIVTGSTHSVSSTADQNCTYQSLFRIRDGVLVFQDFLGLRCE